MNAIYSINNFTAVIGVCVLIMIDYYRSRSTDAVQRGIFSIIIAAAIMSLFAEITYDAYRGLTYEHANRIFYAANFLFFVFQPVSHSMIVLFFDYNINKNIKRVKLLACILGSALCVFIALLLLNVSGRFIFYTTTDNEYIKGTLYFIRLIISFLPALIITVDVLLCMKVISRHQMALYIIFLLSGTLGGVLDLTIDGLRLLWPCFCISMLFAYFFIIRADFSIDRLTGIHNRHNCDEFLENLDKFTRTPSGFMMIDMDHFKQINDNYGHSQGDKALRDAAQLLKESVRPYDYIARYGGDEFVVIVRDAESVEHMENVAGRIRKSVSDFNARKERKFVLELSIGYGIYEPCKGLDPHKFLSQVDSLMYKNKKERHKNKPDTKR